MWQLSQAVRNEIQRRRKDVKEELKVDVPCASLGRMFFPSRPSTRIIKAVWHPASLGHIALLCSGETCVLVRLFLVTFQKTIRCDSTICTAQARRVSRNMLLCLCSFKRIFRFSPRV